MSVHVVPGTHRETGWQDEVTAIGRRDLQAERRSAVVNRLYDLCLAFLRQPSDLADDGTDWRVTFTPDLSAAEVTVFDRLAQTAKSTVSITPAEYDAIRADIKTIRDLRQLGRNAFMALTAAERDRMLYDAQAATTSILLALLRD